MPPATAQAARMGIAILGEIFIEQRVAGFATLLTFEKQDIRN
jgi:hypothetical protein